MNILNFLSCLAIYAFVLIDFETFLINQSFDDVHINITDETAAIMFLKLHLILYADDKIFMSDDVNKFPYLLKINAFLTIV